MCKNLLLFPTDSEKRACEPALSNEQLSSNPDVAICGFGLVSSGVAAARAIQKFRPDHVWLLGIAGSYDEEECQIGEAVGLTAVAVDGIGCGQGENFQSAEQMGWKQFSGDEQLGSIGQRIRLNGQSPASLATPNDEPLLLSVCSASANAAEAAQRKARWPTAVAEDMEGFAVAMACQLANVPLKIIRGISNIAGDRDHKNWKIDEALQAVASLALQQLQQKS